MSSSRSSEAAPRPASDVLPEAPRLPRFAFERIYLTPGAEKLPAAERALARLPGLEIRETASKEDIPEEHKNSGTLFITRPRGEVVGPCPGTHGHICCNYLTVDVYLGCTLGCTYCIMKSYLNFEPVTVYADPRPALERIRRLAEKNPGRMLRVGSGETGDSLLLDPLFELSGDFITDLADLPNVYFESKTKTNHVDHLLGLPKKGNAVIGFSLNAESVSEAEEGCSASVGERLAAAEKALRAGYLLAFHFDPLIAVPDWRRAYGDILDRLRRFPGGRIAWISLGTLRYPPALKERMEDRPYLYDEFVPCRDGKFRYVQKKRTEIYAYVKNRLSEEIGAPVYLCMESADVWRKLWGTVPMKISPLRAIFERTRGAEKTRPRPEP